MIPGIMGTPTIIRGTIRLSITAQGMSVIHSCPIPTIRTHTTQSTIIILMAATVTMVDTDRSRAQADTVGLGIRDSHVEVRSEDCSITRDAVHLVPAQDMCLLREVDTQFQVDREIERPMAMQPPFPIVRTGRASEAE